MSEGGDLFLYGTLRYRPLLEVVLGRTPRGLPARLAGHRAHWAEGQPFPLLVAAPGASAEGLLLGGLSEGELARLDYYEGGFGFALREVTVQTPEGPRRARAWFAREGVWRPGAPFDLDDWARRWGEMSVSAAAEYMEGFGTVPAEEAARRLAQMQQRAWSRVLARAGSVPPAIRSGPEAGQVELLARRRPYTNYFALEEHELRFPLFDGSMSAQVTRAAFVSGDAVTVLPYDPRRDRVLVVEQFRHGPFVRGDRWPWTLEPVAGRIDPGETPEEAARREMAEEAGLEAGRLYRVGGYYPSPGACSEYLHAFVAEADLPDGAAGTFGVDHEAEDIRGHLLGFATAMELLSTGEADTGPLILSLLWLAARREAIRAGA